MKAEKAKWRVRMRGRLKKLSLRERARRSQKIISRLKKFLIGLRPARVAVFEPLRSEPELGPLFRWMKKQKIPHFVPRRAPPKTADLWLVPGLAFDRQGRRLGRGGGVYDKWLGEKRGLAAGVCFEFQVVRRVPSERHDQKVDWIFTDRRARAAE